MGGYRKWVHFGCILGASSHLTNKFPTTRETLTVQKSKKLLDAKGIEPSAVGNVIELG